MKLFEVIKITPQRGKSAGYHPLQRSVHFRDDVYIKKKTILSDCFNIPGHEYVAVSLKSAVFPGFSQICHRL